MKTFQDFAIDIGNKSSGKIKTKCPQCSATRKNKRDKCLSVDIDKGLFNCHNCGWAGTTKFEKKKEFVKPEKIKVNLTDRIIKWFYDRGISEPTLIHWKIGESLEYFPQVGKKRRAINFNYYRENDLVNVKYRDGQKNFKMVSGAELIFYGLDNIKTMDKIYIVEGEIDALSLHEAGIYSVCSVPNGASKGNQRLEYLDNCFEYFKDKKEIVLCTDNDSPGIQLRKELARRFGAYRCKYVDFGDYKDANEILVTKGGETLRNVIKMAKNFPLEGVLNIENIWQSVLNYNENGVKNYSIGLPNADNYFKMSFGEWSVVTGIPNSGKSDVMDMICCNLALKYDFRCGMFAPESFPYEGHIKRIANKLNETNCNNSQLNQTKDFIQDHFFWVKIDLENLTLKGILNSFRELVFQKGINVFVIDPWNMLDHSAQRDHSYIGRSLSEITQFCQQTNTHLFLVAHPRKIESENGTYKKPTLYDISGSADFFNKAYNGLIVYRCIGQKTKYESDIVKIYIEKVKRKENGQLGEFDIAPDFRNGGIYKDVDLETKKFEVIKDNLPF
ncbi:MAG: putative bifunctional DNA primase/polymerase [Prokaryotic dsDNA virus sp.]|jgi:twinkle protein|nr:MAG: putative bifunctional DNA primase/polymerase [Prokaryotic dsDNA virus sp.]|tara:strand:+ start:468 stop:2141 length:1674 start_codon:yes stop_codon:yes gene_type:complete